MLYTIAFPKTALVFRYYSLKKLRHLLVDTSFKDFWYLWQYADRLIITFLWSSSKPLLSFLCIKSVKVSEFDLIIFVGRSDSWQGLELLRFKISRFISDFVISWNENRLSMPWLIIAIMLGWFFYCSITCKWSLVTRNI